MAENTPQKPSSKPKPSIKQKPSVKQLLISTLGAVIGVQSDKVRQKDFEQSSPIPYIVCGIVFTTLFVLSLIFIVSLIVE